LYLAKLIILLVSLYCEGYGRFKQGACGGHLVKPERR